MIGVRAATAQLAGCSDSTSVEGSRRSLPSSWRWPLGERPTRSEWRSSGAGWTVRCLIRQQRMDTKRTHQKRHARRLPTHLKRPDQPDLQEKLCRE